MNTQRSQQWQHYSQPEISGMGRLPSCDLRLERPDYSSNKPFVEDDYEEF